MTACNSEPEQSLYWSAIHVSGNDKSGDAHLLELPDGRAFLIDTGYPQFAQSNLLPYLKEREISHLSGVLISHAHRNHYGALLALAKEIPIDIVYFNRPDHNLCLLEARNDRCLSTHVEETLQQLASNTKVKSAGSGDILIDAPYLKLSVLHQSNSLNSEASQQASFNNKKYTINESSVVARLQYGDISILFPGDIGPTTGEFLVESFPKNLQSTLLAAPHHGVNPLPGVSFFQAVNAKLIIASISASVFNSHRGEFLRQITTDRPLVVTGNVGNVRVRISKTEYELELPQ